MTRSTMMPMSSAGILGMGSNMELEGIKITPQLVLGVALVFVIGVKILDHFFMS
ncbi:preprotein translocase subunit Sec61beta [Candidatus Micrarchaeota archaeon]|nr:preprotein translocase subunit Sec61beta [Candidatus Micrarchaeota archaeon]